MKQQQRGNTRVEDPKPKNFLFLLHYSYSLEKKEKELTCCRNSALAATAFWSSLMLLGLLQGLLAAMESTSAASAMKWSIQLEKGLRSNKPGAPIEAILQIGPQLQQWSIEPESNMAANAIFGLVPGEDRLFANAILLRLADAFSLGDKDSRFSIVRVFLSELKHRDNKNPKGYKGLLSKARVTNQLELLKRVKSVFDIGDTESRALSLVLFGCWAHFAIDNAQIRYMILSTLVSPNDWEVKASLFAAGCFCEISDDFACITLEMLVNMVISSETSLPVKLAAARVFAKFRCSHSVAKKAYKTGLELVLNSSDGDFLVAMLFSLSKLATISTLLITKQVGFLLSFLHQERTSNVQETTLKCLHFLFAKGLCHYPVNSDLIHRLFCILEEPEVSLTMQCLALRVLHKVLLCIPLSSPFMELHEFVKLLTVAENAIHYPLLMKTRLTFSILADLSCKIVESRDNENGVFCCSSLPSRVISLIKDQITLSVIPLLEASQNDSKLFQDLQSLLKILLSVLGKHPYLGVLVLDNLNSVIEYLVTIITTDQAALSDHVTVKFEGEKRGTIISKFVRKIYKFLVACLENLYKAGAIDTEVLNRVQIMAELVCQFSLFDCYTYTLYCLLLHSRPIWGGLVNVSDETSDYGNLSIFPHSCFLKCKIDTLEFVHKILTETDNWTVYKVGAYAACQGEWLMATAIFRKLIQKVKSDSCCSWLEALFQYADSEGKIQFLILPKQRSTLMDWLENNKFPLTCSDNLDEKDLRTSWSLNDYYDKLLAVHGALCSSMEILETAVTSCQAFCFQRWLLSLRARVLENVAAMLRVLREVPLNMDWNCSKIDNIVLESLKSQEISRISFKLQSLAEELDLVGTSFIEMDNKSSTVIAALALSCSLLAFTAGFAVSIIGQHSHGLFTVDKTSYNLQLLTMQNLMGRLWDVDHETRKNLSLLLNFIDQHWNCFHLQPRYQTQNIGYEDQEFLNICSYAVSGAVSLQDEVNKEHSEKTLSEVTKKGLLLNLDTIMKWMHIPFRIPKYFFKVRQSIGSELFVHNEDTRNGVNISVLPGLNLSLNLCLQLKNVPPSLHLQLTKLYCILYCGVSFQVPAPGGQTSEQLPSVYQAWKDDEIVELNKKLFFHVSDCMKNKSTSGKLCRDNGNNKVVEVFLQFEPNQKGLGFSRCILDVSNFPVGSYRIKWHSCLVDSQGSYWSVLPLNMGPVFTIPNSMVA